MAQLMWGWRVTCALAGCERSMERWRAEEGVPPLEELDGEEKWVWIPQEVQGIHRAFCPDHAHVWKEYRQKRNQWQTARWMAGKGTAVEPSGLVRLLSLFRASTPRKDRLELIREWEAQNPKPRLPVDTDSARGYKLTTSKE